MNNHLYMALHRVGWQAAARDERMAWALLARLYGRRRAEQAHAVCNPTARAMAHVCCQWIAAGIDKGE